jgi:hypothetical protein
VDDSPRVIEVDDTSMILGEFVLFPGDLPVDI